MRKKKVGRPPRRDSPQRIAIVLPGRTRRWLRMQAAREERDQGDVVAQALAIYKAYQKLISADAIPKDWGRVAPR